MESPTGIIPEELMNFGCKTAVLDYLRAQPWPGDFKRQVLRGWGLWVRATLDPSEVESVGASGWK